MSMGQMSICKLVEKVDRKLVVYELWLKLCNVFEEQISSALQGVWSIIHCQNILILNFEEWLPSGRTQQFKGLDNVGTLFSGSGNNLQSSILTCTKNLTQEPHQQVSLSASTAEIVSNWLLPLSMQTMNLKN
jgi:hypothetical protein